MKTVLNIIGVVGVLLCIVGFSALDSNGIGGTIAVIMTVVGLILVNIWVQTEGRQWAN